MRLIRFLILLFVLALSSPAQAQQPKKVPRIGFLGGASASSYAVRIDAFRQGLNELGYIEGKNIVIEYRYAEGKLDRLPVLMNSGPAFGDPIWIVDGDTLEISSNPIIERYPFVNPTWNETVRTHLLQEIEKMTRLLPLIDGSMEIAPLKVYDNNRTQSRRQKKENERKISYDELHDLECKGEDESGFPLSKLEFDRLKDSGFMDQIDPVDLINAQEKFERKLERKVENVNPPRKRAQIHQSIRSIVFCDQSAKDAAKQNGVCEKTVSKYKAELGF